MPTLASSRPSARLSSYDYAWLRVVPRVEMVDCLTVGVILFCRTRRFLGVRIVCNRARLVTLWPRLDLDALEEHLALLPRICAGEGPIGGLGRAEVFHWVVAPHSTVLQASPVHSGLSADPAATLEALAAKIDWHTVNTEPTDQTAT